MNNQEIVDEVMQFFDMVREMSCNDSLAIPILPEISEEAKPLVRAFLKDHPEEDKFMRMLEDKLEFYPSDRLCKKNSNLSCGGYKPGDER
ncbi:hypothetical protein KAR91_07665 [Candidatus Pacearchaeota archaeon]|nr:hypothetical protein [Candidatus Pacearchaeota archaeon]